MLTSELLVARKRGDSIRPVFAELNEENLEVAKKLIDTFKKLIGERKGELRETLEDLEGLGYDFRYVRGLSTLLERQSNFETHSAIQPSVARRRLFYSAAKKGIPVTLTSKIRILEEEAKELGVSIEDMETSLYADLEDESILTKFQPFETKRLVRTYNLSLVQTLLFRSSEMEFTASGNWQNIFRSIKWLGLIYTIQKNGVNYWVKVDGPISLFKLNTRYGTSLAKLIPHIIVARDWKIRAKVLRRKSDRRLLNLSLDSHRHKDYISVSTGVEEAYDSVVEQDFAKRFKTYQSSWKLTREPNPLITGRYVMIPDFLFEKAGIKIYMEVAGFWTPEYLRHKIKQLQELENVDMIVAANRSNACHQMDSLSWKLNIIYYRNKIPLQPVIKHLKSREDDLKRDQLKKIQGLELSFEDVIVELEDVARKLGVLKSVVEEFLKKRNVTGYLLLGDTLIKKDRLKIIEERLNERISEKTLNLEDAINLIEDWGGIKPILILEKLGYRIEWHGIDPQKAIVYKKL